MKVDVCGQISKPLGAWNSHGLLPKWRSETTLKPCADGDAVAEAKEARRQRFDAYFVSCRERILSGTDDSSQQRRNSAGASSFRDPFQNAPRPRYMAPP